MDMACNDQYGRLRRSGLRVEELAKDERHNTLRETHYWCDQYKQAALRLEAERDRLLALLRKAEWAGQWAGSRCAAPASSRCGLRRCPWCRSCENCGHTAECPCKAALEE